MGAASPGVCVIRRSSSLHAFRTLTDDSSTLTGDPLPLNMDLAACSPGYRPSHNETIAGATLCIGLPIGGGGGRGGRGGGTLIHGDSSTGLCVLSSLAARLAVRWLKAGMAGDAICEQKCRGWERERFYRVTRPSSSYLGVSLSSQVPVQNRPALSGFTNRLSFSSLLVQTLIYHTALALLNKANTKSTYRVAPPYTKVPNLPLL